MRNIEDYGNKLSIIGIVVGNGEEAELLALDKLPDNLALLQPSETELVDIFNQLDTLSITNTQKVVLRKSQRNIDQKISWTVFRRDGFKCQYCGDHESPMTIDHLVLWEEDGDTVPANLLTSCKKCNHTRGNMPFDQWLKSSYLISKLHTISNHPDDLKNMVDWLNSKYEKAKQVPLRKTKRSR